MILNVWDTKYNRNSITRTCGGDPCPLSWLNRVNAYYPHMRGWSIDYLYGILDCNRITRTCGGDPQQHYRQSFLQGYYPHMRGWSYAKTFFFDCSIVLPAHAGVIHRVISTLSIKSSITRTCGGDPDLEDNEYELAKYYPHMRGWSW